MIGAVLAGGVQDFVVLFCSLRRDGKSLGQMAREEIGKIGGFAALVTVLMIMVILLAVVALVIVNALKGSPWGAFTIAATIPLRISWEFICVTGGPARCWSAPRSASY